MLQSAAYDKVLWADGWQPAHAFAVSQLGRPLPGRMQLANHAACPAATGKHVNAGAAACLQGGHEPAAHAGQDAAGKPCSMPCGNWVACQTGAATHLQGSQHACHGALHDGGPCKFVKQDLLLACRGVTMPATPLCMAGSYNRSDDK